MISLIFGGVVSIIKVVAGPILQWYEKRAQLKQAAFDVELARLEAEKELQVYKIKADLEWDLQWSKAAEKSWKDEYLLVLWSLPFIAAFLPWTQEHVKSGFSLLTMLNADAAYWYFAAWSVMFSAVFGVRAAMGVLTKNSNLGKAIEAVAEAPDDIPEEAANSISKRLADAREERKKRPPGQGKREDQQTR